jgi:hypothetical protein
MVSMYNDVWYSEDGSQWYEAIADIDKDDPELIWRARAGAIALVKGGWLYILGGERAFLSGPHAAIFFSPSAMTGNYSQSHQLFRLRITG